MNKHTNAAIPDGFVSRKTKSAEINLHYVRGGNGTETVILIHGWPQIWTEWRRLMSLLADEFDVVAMDLRGFGSSDRAAAGYDKKTLAGDVLNLMDELGIEKAHIVSHDIGSMIAFAFAYQWPEKAMTLTLMDAPMPGTDIFDVIKRLPLCWHFPFHAAADVPEALTKGREDYYYTHFMHEMDMGSGGVNDALIAETVEAYSDPETAKAGFSLYRTFDQDSADNKAFMQKLLEVPVLALNNGIGTPYPYLLDSLKPFVATIEGHTVPTSGHWIPETIPEELSIELKEFFARHT